MNICISRHLKEEMAWDIDKQLWVISDKMLFKMVTYATEKMKNRVVSYFKTILYVFLLGP